MGLNTEDWSYELGQGWVADDFDEQLTGATAGDVLTFTTTPKGTEEAADFTVTVKSVQALELPEPTDEWVAENTGEFETVEEWEASIVDRLTESKLGGVRQPGHGAADRGARRARRRRRTRRRWCAAEMQSQLQNMFRQLQSQGIDPQAWMSATGQDIDELIEGTRPQAEQAVKADLALRAVAEAEGIEVDRRTTSRWNTPAWRCSTARRPRTSAGRTSRTTLCPSCRPRSASRRPWTGCSTTWRWSTTRAR